MRTVIINQTVELAIPPALLRILPYKLTDELRRLELVHIEEIRIRRGRCAAVTSNGRNYMLEYVCAPYEMDDMIKSFCGGALYAHAENIREGYIMFGNGIRIGVCGRAAVQNGNILGVDEISSAVIRLPHKATVSVGGEIAELVRSMGLCRGVLIYSPPGVGKTTVLRGIAASLAGGEKALRVCLVDTRGELAFSLESPRLCVDILTGYPRREGICVAARTLGAQVILCDEIGDSAEADAIISAHNCGIPLIASAHAASLKELLSKPGIACLHKCHTFGAYVGLKRARRPYEYEYEIDKAEEVEYAI